MYRSNTYKEEKHSAMYFHALVFALAFSVVSTQRHREIAFCTKSTMCPSGSSCVKGICVDCTCEPLRCLISVEICAALNCATDEDCFLQHQTNYATRTAAVHPACQKRNPCASVTCKTSEQCQLYYCGDQQPAGRCVSSTADPCTNVNCPTNYYCQPNNAYCAAVPCKTDAACADLSACRACSYQQHCELQEQHDSTFTGHLLKGVCAANSGNSPFFPGPGGPAGPGGPGGNGPRQNRRPGRRF